MINDKKDDHDLTWKLLIRIFNNKVVKTLKEEHKDTFEVLDEEGKAENLSEQVQICAEW